LTSSQLAGLLVNTTGDGLGSSLLLSGEDSASASNESLRVESDHNTEVGERVLLARKTALNGLITESRLNFVGVGDSGDIGVAQDGARRLVTLLLSGDVLARAEETVEGLEGVLSPDDESAQVTSRSKLEQVQARDVGQLDARNVAESLDDGTLVLVDNQRTTTLDVASVSHLALTTTDVVGVLDLLDVLEGVNRLEELNGLLGLDDTVESGLVDNQGDLSDLFDAVTTSHNKRSQSRGSQSGANGVSALVLVGLSVPSSPNLGRGEHATTTAHVSESTLAGARSTTTRNTRNTGNSATGTPGLGRVLHTSSLGHCVGLSLVLGDLSVNKVDDVRTDGAGEDIGQSNLLLLGVLGDGLNGD
jgi:hypothetical protein